MSKVHPNHLKPYLENIPFGKGEFEETLKWCVEEAVKSNEVKVYTWGGLYDLIVCPNGEFSLIPTTLRRYKLNSEGYVENVDE